MRRLHPDLKTYIDGKLSKDVIQWSPIEVMLSAANVLIGVGEAADPSKVDLIRYTIATPWGEPWCADFVQTCVAYAEAVKGVISHVAATEGVLDLWARSPESSRATTPQRGDIVLWRLGETHEGHCGLITTVDTLLYSTIEGNTSDSAGIDRMGRGVFAKKRARGGTKTFSEVGFLRCFT